MIFDDHAIPEEDAELEQGSIQHASIDGRLGEDSTRRANDSYELIKGILRSLSKTMEFLLQAKTNTSDYLTKSKDVSLLNDTYKFITKSIDQLTKGMKYSERAKVLNNDIARERDHNAFVLNNLKLELNKLTEYDTQLSSENYELVKRAGVFEEQIQMLEQQVKRGDDVRKEMGNAIDDLQEKLLERAKAIEERNKEISRMEVEMKEMKKNIEILDSINKQYEAKYDAETKDLKDSHDMKNEAVLYKDLYMKSNEENRQYQIANNSLTSLNTMMKSQHDSDAAYIGILKKEIKELKDRINELEVLKNNYLNNLSMSKLQLSNINFSKMFQHETEVGHKHEESPINDRESVVNVVRKIDDVKESKEVKEAMKESNIFDIPRAEKKVEFSGINFFAVDEGPNSNSSYRNNPYREEENRSLLKLRPERNSLSVMKDSLKFRDSRVSSLLLAMGGYEKSKFDIRQDYMSMSSNSKVVEELNKLGDEIETSQCYSDTVFLFDKNFKKSRFIIVVTKSSISFFNLKKTRLLKLYQMKSLKGITISANNYTLSVLHFSNQADLLLESYRRLELVLYVNHVFKLTHLNKFEIVVRKRFIIKSDPKQQVPEKIELTDPNLPINMSSLQDTIRNARKAGYLEKQRKHWFMGTTQQEYFCMLCNIGLLLFKKYGVGLRNRRIRTPISSNPFSVPPSFVWRMQTQRSVAASC